MQKGKITYFIRLLTICIILQFNLLKTNGQDTLKIKYPKNSIHVDCASLLYIGMYSVNYEKAVFQTAHSKIFANVGIGGWYRTTISIWYRGYSIPLSLNFLIGTGNSHFETDLGIRYTEFSKWSAKDSSPFFPIFNLGYRYQRPDGKGLLFRTFIGLSGVGIGLGKAF